MPRDSPKYIEIYQVYSPRLRANLHPYINWKFLHRAAGNLAASFATLHEEGYVVGDVNQGNILVDPAQALVTLVDTDSFQVKDPSSGYVFRCPVGMLGYTPPEMRLVSSFDCVDRAPSHDLFGFGVLVFKLLMEGFHPFMGGPKNP